MSIDELVCEFNVYFIEVIFKENLFPFPFFCNKEYKSYKEKSLLEKIKNEKNTWFVSDLELDEFITEILKLWSGFIIIDKMDSTSIIIRSKN
jgi:hypothetical protein